MMKTSHGFIRVSKPTVRAERDRCVLSVSISTTNGSNELWFAVPTRWAAHLNTSTMDAFLVALLPVAMSRGERLELDGLVSERLHYHITSYLVPLLTQISPRFEPIDVIPSGVSNVRNSTRALGASTGFSGGIDSFCVIADHFSLQSTPSYRIGTLLFNNVGAVPYQRFQEKWRALSKITDITGLELIPIDSNLGTLVELPFALTHSLRNIACSLVLQGLYDKHYYASGYSYASTHVPPPANNIATADPLLLPLLSTEYIDIIPSGGQHSRVDKTKIVAAFAPSYEMLNVCVAANRIDNCSACWKCGRTLLTLELLDQIETYAAVFDLNQWRNVRSAYIAEYVTNPKKTRAPLTREIHDLARDAGHTFSATERAMGALAAFLPEDVYRPLARACWAN